MSNERPLPSPDRAARQILVRLANAITYLEEARRRGDPHDIQQWEAYLRYANSLQATLESEPARRQSDRKRARS